MTNILFNQNSASNGHHMYLSSSEGGTYIDNSRFKSFTSTSSIYGENTHINITSSQFEKVEQ